MGLLMNHLGVDGKGRVVFDAGDAGVEEEDEVAQEEEEMVDLAKLRGAPQPTVSGITIHVNLRIHPVPRPS